MIPPLFFGWALLPTAALNVFDDLHIYLVRTVRMLATGSIGGNPFDFIGMDGFGAQWFFHGFVLTWCPLSYINAFDGVFCLGLCGLLILAIARDLGLPWGYSVLAIVLFASINPQIVNISSVYSGTAMILGLMMACTSLVRRLEAESLLNWWRTLVPVSLFSACIVSLKSPLAMFGVLHLLIFFILIAWRGQKWKRVAFSAFAAASLTILLTLPWIVLVALTYRSTAEVVARTGIHAVAAVANSSVLARDVKGLFVSEQLLYGGHRWYYNLAVFWVTCAGGVAAFCVFRKKNLDGRIGWLVCGTSAACSLPLLYVLYSYLFDPITGVRYACPLILALVPLMCLLGARMISDYFATGPAVLGSVPTLNILHVAGNLALVAAFLATTTARVRKALDARTQVAYPLDQPHLDYQQAVFSKPAANYVRSIQNRTEPSETILVWAEASAFLDFKRNRILTASENTMVSPWLRFPVGVSVKDLETYLRGFGIRYVLFQSEGFSIMSIPELQPLKTSYPLYRKIAEYNIYAKSALAALSKQSRILYETEYLVLYELTPETSSRTPQTVTEGTRSTQRN
jgi:hypothetical protein